MPPAHRVGDRALNPADAHGCPACPHPVQGPGISGSPDVLVNGRPLMRVGDPGVHIACCGPNQWTVAQGSRSVLVNGRPPSRIGDATSHCGGSGSVIDGSPNVLIGDLTNSAPPPPPPPPPPKPRVVEAWPKDARFFVNLPDDEGQQHGRKVTLKARVDPPQAGVPVRFELLPVAGNASEDIEAGSEARLLTAQATTDGSGVATADMQLSQVAGDQIQARASTEEGGQRSVADTGLQAVWRKLTFDVIQMQRPAEGVWTRMFPGRYSLDDDLAFTTAALRRVYIELEDTGRRHTGPHVPVLRVGKEVEDWCARACRPGPPRGGEAPLIHLAVVPALVSANMRSVVRASQVQLTHLGGGRYAGELPEPPYITETGHILVATAASAPWIGNPAITQPMGGYPNSVDDPTVLRAAPFAITPDGALGTKRIHVDLAALPARLRSGGGFPQRLEMYGFAYYGIAEIAGYCVGGGKYVVVGEQYDGEVLLHELGHALGLTGKPIDTSVNNHCSLPSCTMYYMDDPSSSSDFHGGPTPARGTCAHWLRRLNMTKAHLYERWWQRGGWPEHMTETDAEGCPCGPGMFQ